MSECEAVVSDKEAIKAEVKAARERDFKIRPLEVDDRLFLSHLIEKLADKVGSGEILSLITMASATEKSSEDAEKVQDNGAKTKLGIELMRLLMQVLNSDLHEWFADLLGVSVPAFKKCPFNTEIKIVEQLTKADEVTDFFTGASQQFNEILALSGQSKPKKTK
jgi:hypothetical protein